MRLIRKINNRILFVILLVLLSNCQKYQTPKPHGYFRIDFPLKSYTQVQADLPFVFAQPDYSKLSFYNGSQEQQDLEERWLNLEFPGYNGRIHLTYKPVHSNLSKLINDAHAFVSKHVMIADAITQTRYEDTTSSVYGILFDIKGNTASSVQFFITDSIHHFIRGALYFNVEPNKDSLAPVIDFIRGDMIHLIETINWKTKAP